MLTWLKQFDDLLRGKKTATADLSADRIDVPLGNFTLGAVVFGAFYGACMGMFSLFRADGVQVEQMFASMVKIPALFLLTLVVTFPSLYVFSALMGSPLTFLSTLRLAIAAIVINVIVAASLGLIVAFFTVSTTSYSFMVVLNVLALTIAGFVALIKLLQALHDMTSRTTPASLQEEDWVQTAASKMKAGDEPTHPNPSMLRPIPEPPRGLGTAKNIFRIWVLIYGLVGAQMGWILRPFIGAPKLEFTWFRDRQSNFFEAVLGHLANLLSGGN